jgi:drug/metabolite transporter (DMT)-like permease
MVEGVLLFIGLVWVVMAIAVGMDASDKDRNSGLWFLITLVFGIFGLLAYVIAGSGDNSDPPPQRVCTDCERTVNSRYCPDCGKRMVDLTESDSPSESTSDSESEQYDSIQGHLLLNSPAVGYLIFALVGLVCGAMLADIVVVPFESLPTVSLWITWSVTIAGAVMVPAWWHNFGRERAERKWGLESEQTSE